MGRVSELLATPLLRRSGARPRAPWLAAVVATVWALIAGLALLTLPVVAAWLAGGAEQPLGSVLSLGADAWLVAHRVPVDAGTGVIMVAPWGLALPLALLVFHAARWATHVSGVMAAAQAASVVLVMAAVYGLGGGAIAAATGSAAQPMAALLTGLLAAVAAAAGVAVECGLLAAVVGLLPSRPRSVLSAGGAAAVMIVAGGAALVALSLVAHFGQVTELTRSLDAGVTGGLLVTLLGASLLPNAAVWAGAYAVGAGFAVGSGTLVSPFEVRLGAVPALPVLAGLPADSTGTVGFVVLAIPIAAGVLAAVILHKTGGDRSLVDRICDALGAGLIAGLVMAGLAALSGGAAGPGRLAEVGPGILPFALLTAAEVAITALAATLALAIRRGRLTVIDATTRSVEPIDAG